MTQTNGAVVDTISRLNPDGSLLDKTVTATSATGLSVTTQFDQNGDAVFDLPRADAVVLNNDGSRTRTITATNANASVRSQVVSTTSATGLASTIKVDVNGDGVFDLTTVSNTVLNSDGSRTETVQDKNANGSLREQVVTATSANGLSTTIQSDLDGNGTVDRVLSDVVALNANGSYTETVTERNGDGSLRAQTITTTSADGRSTTVTRDTDGKATTTASRRSSSTRQVRRSIRFRCSATMARCGPGCHDHERGPLDGDDAGRPGRRRRVRPHRPAAVSNATAAHDHADQSICKRNVARQSHHQTSADGRGDHPDRSQRRRTIDIARTDVLVINADGSRAKQPPIEARTERCCCNP